MRAICERFPWGAFEIQTHFPLLAHSPEERERVGKLLPKLSIGLNMIFAMATMFVVCYVGASSIYEGTHQVGGGAHWSLGLRLTTTTTLAPRH